MDEVELETVEKPSLLKRFRLHLLVTGIAFGLIVFMLIGIGLGAAKRNLERKQYAAQLEQVAELARKAQSERKLLEVKLEGFRRADVNKEELVDELRRRLVCFEEAAAQALAAEEAEKEKLALKKPGRKSEVASHPRYLRFGNATCTLIAGDGKAASWKDCLQQQGLSKK